MPGEVICLDGGLFPEPERTTESAELTTAGQRRRARQSAAIAQGQHPLSVALRAPLPLHPDARRDDDRTEDGTPRCGSCRFRRQYNSGHARAYPKCLFGGGERSRPGTDGKRWDWIEYPRATDGDGTDVAPWWPACVSYKPKGEREVAP